MRTVVIGMVVAAAVVGAGAGSQLRVTSPYLDIVERYRSGDQVRAIDELKGIAVSNLRERTRRDLTELPCQVLTGIGDCTRARTQKPTEFERVVEVWTSTLPAAAALHIDAAITAQKAGPLEVREMRVDGRRRGEPDRLADLAHGRRVAVPVDVADEELPDLLLPCREHRASGDGCRTCVRSEG